MPAGRPIKIKKLFETVEKLQEAIAAYFADCDRREAPYTCIGLAYALGVERETIFNYCNNYKDGDEDEFFHTISRARQKCGVDLSEGAIKGTYNSRFCSIIAYNEFGLRKEENINIGGQKDNPVVVESVDVAKMNPEELNEYIRSKVGK
jgi:hypothetical protein